MTARIKESRRPGAADTKLQEVFTDLRKAAARWSVSEALLARFLSEILLSHDSFEGSLASLLTHRLAGMDLDDRALMDLARQAFAEQPAMTEAAALDLEACRDRDPAAPDYLTPFLYFKGFHALQWYRIAHWLWMNERIALASHLQSAASERFGVDIHPAAHIGWGIFIDHGTGVVIGETAVIGNNVSLLQGVTLGGTGKQCGDRHPKVRDGVLIGAGAKILGNIEIGEGAKIGAGSVVLDAVPPYRTAVGVPARVVGPPIVAFPGLSMDQALPSPEYHI